MGTAAGRGVLEPAGGGAGPWEQTVRVLLVWLRHSEGISQAVGAVVGQQQDRWARSVLWEDHSGCGGMDGRVQGGEETIVQVCW